MIFCRKCGRYYSDRTPSCSACGANLKEFGHVSFQGTTVKVPPGSDTHSIAPPRQPIATLSGSEPPVASGDTDPVFDRDKFLLRQKAIAIKEKYYVTDDSGAPLMFVERPALLTQQLIMLAGVAAAFFGGTFVMSFVSGIVGHPAWRKLSGVFSFVGFLAVLAMTGFVFVLLVPKRHVTFYKDDSKIEKLLEIKQMNKLEFPYANFSILDRRRE